MSAVAKPLGPWMDAKSGDGFYRRYQLDNGDKVNGFVKVGDKGQAGAQVFGANNERELRGFHKTIEEAQAACDGFVKVGCPWTGKAAERSEPEDEWERADAWGETLVEPAPESESSAYGVARLRSMAQDLIELADHLEGVT